MSEQKFPEPTVGAVICGPDGRIFLMQSHKWNGRCCIPGGHIELGEKIEDAVVREIREETGLDVRELEFLLFQEYIYGETFWEKRHYIFFDYACKSDSRAVTLNDEAEHYVWVSPEEALNLDLEPCTRRTIEEYMRKCASKPSRASRGSDPL